VSPAHREFTRQFGGALVSLSATRGTVSGQAIPYAPALLPVDLHPVPVELEVAFEATEAAQCLVQVLRGE
jgi:hypothetical protein